MVELIEDQKEIKKIINEKIKGRRLIFTDYYNLGLIRRHIEHEEVLKIFPKFEKIFAIEKETLKYGDVGYELFYKISSNISFSIGTCPKDEKVLIIHAIEYKKSLAKRFRKFKSQ